MVINLRNLFHRLWIPHIFLCYIYLTPAEHFFGVNSSYFLNYFFNGSQFCNVTCLYFLAHTYFLFVSGSSETEVSSDQPRITAASSAHGELQNSGVTRNAATKGFYIFTFQQNSKNGLYKWTFADRHHL